MRKIQHILSKIKTSRYLLVLTCIFTLTAVLNLLAFSTSFCNFYTDTIYGFLSDFLGRLTDWIPVPFGELLMYALAAALFCAILLGICFLIFKCREKWKTQERFRHLFCFAKNYLKGILLLCSLFLLTYTLQWFIPFRSSLLGESGHFEKEYSTEDLRKLWKYAVKNLNEVCTQVPRDKKGHIIFASKKETEKKTADAMKNISDRYARLKGYYPSIKPALCSDVLHWMDIGGYTYPYTMELTYNKYITDLYFPSLYAHESAHHQGYYQENEANFLSFLACMESDDPVLRYSAFHTIYFYIKDAYLSALAKEYKNNTPGIQTLIKEYQTTKLSAQIALDEKEEKRKAEESYSSASHPLEKYSETAENAAGIGWNTQSNVLRENGYDGVVQLLLEYFYG